MLSYFRSIFLGTILLAGSSVLPAQAVFYEYDPDDPGEYAPIREGEKAVIPLDTDDPGYNLWQTTRDDLMKGREPGPINIQRYPGGPGFMGIPTFYKLPIALTPEDLKAGDVDVAIVGAYTDMGGGAAVQPGGPWHFAPLRVVPDGVRSRWIICSLS